MRTLLTSISPALAFSSLSPALVQTLPDAGVVKAYAERLLDEQGLPIRAGLESSARADIEQLRLLRVPSSKGGSVTLGTVAKLEMGCGAEHITRFERQRSVTIKADVGGAALGAVTAAIKELPAMRELPAEVKAANYGDTERMEQLFVEYALVTAGKGMSRREALLEPCSKRARPILMTGGLITSTLLSLFYIPVVITYVDDGKRWLARRFAARVPATQTEGA